jgi:hypothetical protein
MIYLTPCSPGKKVTYSHHDIPDSTAHLAKKVAYSDHDIEQGVRYIMVRISYFFAR